MSQLEVAVFDATISAAGELTPANPRRWHGWLRKHPSQRVSVSLERWKAARGTSANRYLRALYKALSEHTGYHPDEIHDLMRERYVEATPMPGPPWPDGTPRLERRTRTMTVERFAEFVERVEAHWRDWEPTFVFPTRDEWEEASR